MSFDADAKSIIYRNFLPLLNSGRVRLLDNARLISQLVGLERRAARSGRYTIDHRPGGRYDVINAAAGVLCLANVKKRRICFYLNAPCLSYDVFARFSQDGLPPARRELAGGGRGRVVNMLAVGGRA